MFNAIKYNFFFLFWSFCVLVYFFFVFSKYKNQVTTKWNRYQNCNLLHIHTHTHNKKLVQLVKKNTKTPLTKMQIRMSLIVFQCNHKLDISHQYYANTVASLLLLLLLLFSFFSLKGFFFSSNHQIYINLKLVAVIVVVVFTVACCCHFELFRYKTFCQQGHCKLVM